MSQLNMTQNSSFGGEILNTSCTLDHLLCLPSFVLKSEMKYNIFHIVRNNTTTNWEVMKHVVFNQPLPEYTPTQQIIIRLSCWVVRRTKPEVNTNITRDQVNSIYARIKFGTRHAVSTWCTFTKNYCCKLKTVWDISRTKSGQKKINGWRQTGDVKP